MRAHEFMTEKQKPEAYVPPRNLKLQKRHKAQLELGKKYAEWQQELLDLQLKEKELEKEGDETVTAMADRARQKQRVI
jgi:hypothetical protein